MKKIITLIIVLMMLPQMVFANSDLKHVIDDYYYAITVEWDQKDQSFVEMENLKFQNRINDLVKAGLTIDEVKHTLSHKTKIDIGALVNDLDNLNISDSTAMLEYIKLKMKSQYSQGSSWEGDVVITGLLTLGVGALLVVGAIRVMECIDPFFHGYYKYRCGTRWHEDGYVRP
jgi:hypothetical protein